MATSAPSAADVAPMDVVVGGDALVLADIKSNVAMIRKGVATQEARFMARVLRLLAKLRKLLTVPILSKAITENIKSKSFQEQLAAFLQEHVPMDTEGKFTSEEPEVELYIHLLVVVFLIDQKHHSVAVRCAERLVAHAVDTKRRSSDLLSARAYFYLARAHELNGTASTLRGTLHAALRTATLRHDEPGQATLMNALLRNYLQDNLVEQAHLLVTKATFPESAANNESARYLYYLGRVQAVQLDYSAAHRSLLQATRKAPRSAVGFLQAAHKLAVIVEMLLGDVPARSLFNTPSLRRALQPYLQLAAAVRAGDLGKFAAAVQAHGALFQADHTYTLILRLRHNVIKAGLRGLCTAYSRIALTDVARRLQLDSADDAEYIVARAIRDGVIDASINHEHGYIQSKDVVDVYSTTEPQEAFHQRALFCLRLHSDCVKGMRFPPNAYRKFLETPEQRRLRELQETEIAQDMEGEDDGF